MMERIVMHKVRGVLPDRTERAKRSTENAKRKEKMKMKEKQLQFHFKNTVNRTNTQKTSQ